MKRNEAESGAAHAEMVVLQAKIVALEEQASTIADQISGIDQKSSEIQARLRSLMSKRACNDGRDGGAAASTAGHMSAAESLTHTLSALQCVQQLDPAGHAVDHTCRWIVLTRAKARHRRHGAHGDLLRSQGRPRSSGDHGCHARARGAREKGSLEKWRGPHSQRGRRHLVKCKRATVVLHHG